MKALGIPITFSFVTNTYTLTEPYSGLPWKAITGTEVAAILVASFALEALGDSPHASVISSVVDRLANELPETMKVSSDTLSQMLRFETGSRARGSLQYMALLHRAVSERRVMKITYYSNTSREETIRNVEPYSILFHQRHWYVICFCRMRQDMRDFRVDRIRDAYLLDDVFSIPTEFDLDTYLGSAFGMHRGDKEYPVHIRFSEFQARWIQEEVWHESQLIVRRSDGTLDLMMQVTGLNDVARWVLSYGGEAEVISPPALRHRVAVEARRMALIYQDVPVHMININEKST
jgi:predicted DNA-binding transcriptional regulator YafY